MTARLDDFAQAGIYAFNGICRVNHSADSRRKCKEWDDVGPSSSPACYDGGEFLTPGSFLEFTQLGFSRFRARRSINRLERGRELLALFPAGLVEAVADQMHDAGL